MSKKSKSRWHRQDPYAKREAEKYENPIPSREYILGILVNADAPLNYQEILAHLALSSPEDQEALTRRLKAMERDGQVVRNRLGGYGSITKMDLVRGRVMGHRDGFGFLIPDEGGHDLYLSPRQMRSLMHGDRAVAHVIGVDERGRLEGAVIEVLERAVEKVVGRYFQEKGIGFVIPEDRRIQHRILVPSDKTCGAASEQIVVAVLSEQPSKHSPPIGEIIEVMGEHLAPGMEIDIAIRAHSLPNEWPVDLLKEIRTLTESVREEDKLDRVDLRHLPLVTIDGEDAKDFDDAVYCCQKPKGFQLIVAIADVSHYVHPETALDQEAFHRGTSVYFPERVIPMLPEILSNGLCSLKPQVDRLSLACELYITEAGKILRSKFFEAVICSAARLTYNEVAAMIVDHHEATCQRYAHLLPPLQDLYALYQVLSQARLERGAIDFETLETQIIFSQNRKIEAIVPRLRNDAHRLIEECMIAANVAAARFLERHRIPGLYRVHDGPNEEKLANLRAFLGEIGLKLEGGDKPGSHDYAKLLNHVKKRDDFHRIQTVMLRSLSQAIYTPDNTGHFGLAQEKYAHFTSPIRRYPDLLVHRAIRYCLRGGKTHDFFYPHEAMITLGEHCSMTERRADEATWDVIGWLKCEYMMDKVGQTFSGVISGVTAFGLFVELDNIYVEGLIHVTALKSDYYHFDPAHHRLLGERTHKIYRLGDKVKIRVAAVNLDDRKIDFQLAETPPSVPKKKESVTVPPKQKRSKSASSKPQPEHKVAASKSSRRRKRRRRVDTSPS